EFPLVPLRRLVFLVGFQVVKIEKEGLRQTVQRRESPFVDTGRRAQAAALVEGLEAAAETALAIELGRRRPPPFARRHRRRRKAAPPQQLGERRRIGRNGEA